MALTISGQDRTWGTETVAVAGGQLVLTGPGLYVNRAIACGIDPPLRPADVALIVDRSRAVGVPPAIEVTPVTAPESITVLAGHGFTHVAERDTTAHVHTLDDLDHDPAEASIEIVPVGRRSLEEWQDVSALGWGHDTAEARRVADTYARAALERDGDGMVMAFDASDGRPLGCASMTIIDDVATLGGMSTIPSGRGRGVQGALIRHRLARARAAGCSLATTMTIVGGASERNVQRYGFRPTHVRQTWVGR